LLRIGGIFDKEAGIGTRRGHCSGHLGQFSRTPLAAQLHTDDKATILRLAEESYSGRIRSPAFKRLEHAQNGFSNAALPVTFPIQISHDAAHFTIGPTWILAVYSQCTESGNRPATVTASRTKGQKASEVERVYRTLREWLIHGKLRPGDFLSEAQLAEQ